MRITVPRTAAATTLAAVLLLAPAGARAQAVSVQLFTKVAQGQAPRIKVVASESVSAVVINLTRDDGKKLSFRVGAMADGAFREILLGQPSGRHRYRGTLVATRQGQKQESDLEFDAVVAPPLQIQVDKAKVDLAGSRLEVKLSRPAGKVEVRVIGDGGMVLAEEEHSFTGKAAGEPLEVTWSPRSKAEVVKIELRAYDEDGFFSGMAIVPWAVHIPHEEVAFKTDSAEIEATEKPKLEASFTKIAEALARHKELGNITLFIAGHTDTVGLDTYNLTLSRKRAQSIGGWFRKRGLRIPIAYEGFGEHAPLVRTADNVDEPRNRRVDYILAVEEPALKAVGFRAAWKRIN